MSNFWFFRLKYQSNQRKLSNQSAKCMKLPQIYVRSASIYSNSPSVSSRYPNSRSSSFDCDYEPSQLSVGVVPPLRRSLPLDSTGHLYNAESVATLIPRLVFT